MGEMAHARPVLLVVPEAPIAALGDEELVAAVRACDPTVAAAAHDRLRPCVERMIACLLAEDHPKREAVVALALVRAVRSIASYADDGLLDGWMSAMAARVAREHGRFVPPSRNLRLVRKRSVADRVREHLQVLDDKIVWAFLLHDVCGFDLLDVAQIAETRADEVQALLVRARRLLHARIVEDTALAAALRAEDPGVAGRPFFAATAASALRRASYAPRRARPVHRARTIAAIGEALLARRWTRVRRARLRRGVALFAIVLSVLTFLEISCVPFFSSSP
jgi:DNA-directed RNA polymerase specialized sigma24 family protein